MFITQAPKENTSNIRQLGSLKHFCKSATHKICDFLISPPLHLLYDKREQVPHSLELYLITYLQDRDMVLTKVVSDNSHVASTQKGMTQSFILVEYSVWNQHSAQLCRTLHNHSDIVDTYCIRYPFFKNWM